MLLLLKVLKDLKNVFEELIWAIDGVEAHKSYGLF